MKKISKYVDSYAEHMCST